jgi:hypothetical protein
MNFEEYDWNRLDGLGFKESTKDDLKDACWSGYKAYGLKKKGGRMVPNCVKIDSKHSEGDIATAEMTPNYLPKEPGEGDEKNPQMNEGTPIRMPRMEVIKKAADKNGQLAMHASANDSSYSEVLQSTENNGGMIITQLRVAQEKIEIMLDMLDAEDNLPPWAATKIANAGVALASVGDYIRFGEEG